MTEVLSLPDAKAYLKVEDVELDTPALLPSFIAAAVSVIEGIVGPLLATPVTETVTCGRSGSLVLSTLPVLSLTSITSVLQGTDVATAGYDVDDMSGVVRWASSYPVFPGLRYRVTYLAGRVTDPADLPADLMLAVKQVLKQVASSYRAGKRRSDTVLRKGQTPTGIDNRPSAMVEMLIAPHIPPRF